MLNSTMEMKYEFPPVDILNCKRSPVFNQIGWELLLLYNTGKLLILKIEVPLILTINTLSTFQIFPEGTVQTALFPPDPL